MESEIIFQHYDAINHKEKKKEVYSSLRTKNFRYQK